MNLRPLPLFFATTLSCVCALSTRAYCAPPDNGPDRGKITHFVPNSQEFWDFSKNWTTNFGPAYRDTAVGPSGFLPCTGQYALCFHSGPKPLPCRLTDDGRFANCKCTVQTGLNFVPITGILNSDVYQRYRQRVRCRWQRLHHASRQGSRLQGDRRRQADSGRGRNLHLSARAIKSDLVELFTPAPAKPKLTICPKAPYAGCMTAPCKITDSGPRANVSCPIFWGIFQLTGAGARCTLGDDLVNSASYAPARDGLQ